MFWAQWPAPVDFREESQLPVVPLHTGSPSANMNCLRVLILPPPTSAVGFYRPIASQPQVITRAREVRATQGGSYTTTHRAGPWFLGRSPPVVQTVIFSPAFTGPSWLSRFLALCLPAILLVRGHKSIVFFITFYSWAAIWLQQLILMFSVSI